MPDHGVSFTRVIIASLLNPVCKDAVNDVVSLENQAGFIITFNENCNQKEEYENDADAALFHVRKQLYGLAVASLCFIVKKS